MYFNVVIMVGHFSKTNYGKYEFLWQFCDGLFYLHVVESFKS